jgi:hypothetical protein
MQKSIDFTAIRGDVVTAKRTHFEQLVCHLAALNGDGTFQRIHGPGGDGGVEAIRWSVGGPKIGYQAKYYLCAADIDWAALDKSVLTALTQHRDLNRYVIALPCDFTGRRAVRNGGSTEGMWGTWDKHVKSWETLAQHFGMTVGFQPWTAFELEEALFQPKALHLHQFFFNRLTFSNEWMQLHAARTLADLQARYSPDDHVDTKSLHPFDVVFRKTDVVQALRDVFGMARDSDPGAAAAMISPVEVPGTAVADAEKLRQLFLELEPKDELEPKYDDVLDAPWPVYHWFASWHYLTRALSELNSILMSGAGGDDSLRERIGHATKAYDLRRPEVFGGQWAWLLPIDPVRAVLFVGRAGEGKSHALAKGAQDAANNGAPRIHLLGQHILDDDPRTSILKRLGLEEWGFDHFLAALNLAAQAAGTRALLIIDALNEGRGLEVWRKNLAGFIHDVNQYDRIVLVMSCREEYLDYVVPAELIAPTTEYPTQSEFPAGNRAPLGKLVPVAIRGFSTPQEQEDALFQFMDKNGIARPTAPLLDQEFFNPLFMSSVCRAMKKAGLKVFPKGLHATREMFAFVLQAKSGALGTPHDGTARMLDALRSALGKLAAHMATARQCAAGAGTQAGRRSISRTSSPRPDVAQCAGGRRYPAARRRCCKFVVGRAERSDPLHVPTPARQSGSEPPEPQLRRCGDRIRSRRAMGISYQEACRPGRYSIGATCCRLGRRAGCVMGLRSARPWQGIVRLAQLPWRQRTQATSSGL